MVRGNARHRVRACLERPAPRLDRPWLRPVAVALAVIVAVAGPLAGSPGVRAAVADFFRFAGIEVERSGGGSALWLEGAHPVVYVGRDGIEHMESARLAGDTLVVQVGSVTVRLEGDFTRDQAVAVAGSLR